MTTYNRNSDGLPVDAGGNIVTVGFDANNNMVSIDGLPKIIGPTMVYVFTSNDEYLTNAADIIAAIQNT